MKQEREKETAMTGTAAETSAQAPQTVSVQIGLQPDEHSEQPIFSNFTAVSAGAGVAFIDFGFLEPQAMAALANLRKPGGKAPEALAGKLACRMALGLDTVANLSAQLNQLLRNAAAAQAQRQQTVAQEETKTVRTPH